MLLKSSDDLKSDRSLEKNKKKDQHNYNLFKEIIFQSSGSNMVEKQYYFTKIIFISLKKKKGEKYFHLL